MLTKVYSKSKGYLDLLVVGKIYTIKSVKLIKSRQWVQLEEIPGRYIFYIVKDVI